MPAILLRSILFTVFGGVMLPVNTVSAADAAAGPQNWYYTEGSLHGSLKSDAPLPLYDANPEHLWNRLFAAFYIRPSELPSRPEYPQDSTKLDEWDHKLRSGKLPLGPVVKRIEGGDVLGFLAWPKTRHYSEPAVFQRADKLLDEFLETRGERLVADPLKRAFLQRDLWAVFDHLAGQNIARFGDADLARRRTAAADYKIEPEELQRDDAGAIQRRETLCRKLAAAIQRLALPKAAIKALPDNYAVAIRSGQFPARHDFDCRSNYLPPGVLTQPSEWVEIDNAPGSQHRDKAEGQLAYTSWSIRGRSYYRVFWRFPEGRRAVEDYLGYLQREGVDWEKSARQGYIRLKRDVRQIPVGTETAIVEFMVVLDEELNPVPTRVVELVHVNVYKNVDGAPEPQTNTGRGLIARQYVARRHLLFDDLKQGGLERVIDDAPTYRVLLNSPKDWGEFGRQQSVAQTCLHCHMYERDRVGVHSLNSISCHVPEHGMPGVVIAMGSGKVRTYSRAERTVRWKLGQEDYLRLVEYARAAPDR
ncbi:MAG: hypothetical protein A2107_15355 [Verrucomicrobia bacterium GWF2_62_7]|nr:MAG: hypothetical protein A2107_15355 [Verrucomicrobia bacterium GWF2_62_7]